MSSCGPQTSITSPTNFVESKEYAQLLNFRCDDKIKAGISLSNPEKSRQLLEEFDDTDAKNYFKEANDLKEYISSLPVNERNNNREELEAKFLSKRSIKFKNALRSTHSDGYGDPKESTRLLSSIRSAYPAVSIEQIQNRLEADLKNCN